MVGPDLENQVRAPRSFQRTGACKASRIPKHSPAVIELGMRGYDEPSSPALGLCPVVLGQRPPPLGPQFTHVK